MGTSDTQEGKVKIQSKLIVVMDDGAICIRMNNGSSGALARGDLVILDHAEGRNYVTNTTSEDSNLIIGMAYEAIAENASGLIQIYGPTKYLKVDGTDDIAAGDFISTFSTAGIGQKGTIGSGNCIAISTEAYTSNNTSGVIDAFLLGSAR